MSPVVVVKGADHTLRSRALDDTVRRSLGDDDRSLALAETALPPARGTDGDEGGADARRALIGTALDGARTPPFGTEHRVVVIRTDDGFTASETDLLEPYLADPEPTTILVLELPGRVPASLAKALKAAGAEEVVAGGGRDATGGVLAQALKGAGLELDASATKVVTERLGEDAGRVPAIVEVLAAAFGPGVTLSADDVLPYIGQAGAVPIFELTKAIDAGNAPDALSVLQRMTGPMGMHPLQVMALLHNHYRRILRLDDPSIRSEDDAVAALGGKVKPYPAKLAWQRAQALGSEGIRRAFDLLARADQDLRGATGAPDDAVIEVAVTRLSYLGRRGRARTR